MDIYVTQGIKSPDAPEFIRNWCGNANRFEIVEKNYNHVTVQTKANELEK